MHKPVAPVFLLAGKPSAVANAIVDAIVDTGATVATTDLGSGEIRVRFSQDPSATIAMPGYPLSRPHDAERLVVRVLDTLGRIDALINLPTPSDRLDLMAADLDAWDSAFYLTFHHALLLSRAVYANWMRASGGSIINILAGSEERRGVGVEEIGNACLLMLTRELSAELTPFIDVNAVVLGPIDPELESLFAESIVRPVSAPPQTDRLSSIAQTVVTLQQGLHGTHNGQIVILDQPLLPPTKAC